MSDWVLKAIQDEAMRRAREELSHYHHFTIRGYRIEQISALIIVAERDYGIRPSMNPTLIMSMIGKK